MLSGSSVDLEKTEPIQTLGGGGGGGETDREIRRKRRRKNGRKERGGEGEVLAYPFSLSLLHVMHFSR